MPIFATPEPISVALELIVGPTRITASDRTDTVVEVRPTNPNRDGDVKAADQTRVEFDNGRLLVKTPKPRGIFNKGGSVDVSIELPAGSSVRGTRRWATSTRAVGSGSSGSAVPPGTSASTAPGRCGCARRWATSASTTSRARPTC
ncbi:hypothetical protein ACQPW3_30210 [Actinosynnema sp. CA-248983]